MNYQPFSALGQGAIFKSLTHTDIPQMKISNDSAVFLESIWISDKLYPRGYVVKFDATTCVDLQETGEVVVPALRVDPVDPKRKFWKDGSTRRAGKDRDCTINVFAGLFLYSGFGMGTYHSSILNEEFWLNGTDAREKADAEGIPFVRYDAFEWTNDPTLAHERKQAQENFDRRQKEKAEAAAQAAQAEVAAEVA